LKLRKIILYIVGKISPAASNSCDHALRVPFLTSLKVEARGDDLQIVLDCTVVLKICHPLRAFEKAGTYIVVLTQQIDQSFSSTEHLPLLPIFSSCSPSGHETGVTVEGQAGGENSMLPEGSSAWNETSQPSANAKT
jgi:hypothetical protein